MSKMMFLTRIQLLCCLLNEVLASDLYQVYYLHQSATCNDDPYIEYGTYIGGCFTAGFGSTSSTCSEDGNTVTTTTYTSNDCTGSVFQKTQRNLGICEESGNGTYAKSSCVDSADPWEGKDGLLNINYPTDTCDCVNNGAFSSYNLFILNVCVNSNATSFIYTSCADGEYSYSVYSEPNCTGSPFFGSNPVEGCSPFDDDSSADDSYLQSANQQYCSDAYPDAATVSECSDDAVGDDAADDNAAPSAAVVPVMLFGASLVGVMSFLI